MSHCHISQWYVGGWFSCLKVQLFGLYLLAIFITYYKKGLTLSFWSLCCKSWSILRLIFGDSNCDWKLWSSTPRESIIRWCLSKGVRVTCLSLNPKGFDWVILLKLFWVARVRLDCLMRWSTDGKWDLNWDPDFFEFLFVIRLFNVCEFKTIPELFLYNFIYKLTFVGHSELYFSHELGQYHYLRFFWEAHSLWHLLRMSYFRLREFRKYESSENCLTSTLIKNSISMLSIVLILSI